MLFLEEKKAVLQLTKFSQNSGIEILLKPHAQFLRILLSVSQRRNSLDRNSISVIGRSFSEHFFVFLQ